MAQRLFEAELLQGDEATVSGRTLGVEAVMAVETTGQEVVRPLSSPIKKTGGLVDPARLAGA